MSLLLLLNWKLLGLTEGVFRHREWISFVPPQVGISDKLQVQSDRLRLGQLLVSDLSLGQDLANDAAHDHPLVQSLQIDPPNLEFLMNVLFRKFSC